MNAFRFCTDGYRDTDKVAAWREAFGQQIAKLDMQPLGEAPFRGEALVRRLPDLTIGTITSSANKITRTRALIDDGSDDIMLGVVLKGETVVEQGGNEVSVAGGDAVVWSNSSPGSSTYVAPLEFLSVSVPRSVLVPKLVHSDKAKLAVIPRNNPALALLTGYLQMLHTEGVSGQLGSLAATHVHDLVAVAIGATREATHIAEERGVSAARLRAIKADIVANLASADLSTEAIAQRHNISSRLIRKLFRGEDTTFTVFVLGQRLASVHRRLVDPRFAERSISSLAFEAGFGDLSYFNHVFRRHFGGTPSDIRAGK